jgi:hypothetical protein
MDKTKTYYYNYIFSEGTQSDTEVNKYAGTKNGWDVWKQNSEDPKYVNQYQAFYTKEDSKGLYQNFETSMSYAYVPLRYPIKIGTKWQSSEDEKGKIYTTITAINQTIKVKAGTFKNVVVTTASRPYQTTIDYYAPNVGLIKETYKSPGDNESVELIKLQKR